MNGLLYLQHAEDLYAIHYAHPKVGYPIGSSEPGSIPLPPLKGKHVLRLKEGAWHWNETRLETGKNRLDVEGTDLCLFVLEREPHTYAIDHLAFLVIGQDDAADIQLPLPGTLLLRKQNGLEEAQVSADIPFFLNGDLCEGSVSLQEGDELFLDGTLLRYTEDLVYIWTDKEVTAKLLQIPLPVEADAEEEEGFRRSPRIIYREPAQKITIAKPPAPINRNNQSLVRLIIPPLATLALMAVVYMVRPMGIYIIMMVGMSAVTITMSVTNYFSQKKKEKQDKAKRVEQYEGYLENKTMEIHEALQEQFQALQYHYPSFETINEMVHARDRRLYEKTALHHDFLAYRLGLGNQETSFPLEYNEDEFSRDTDELFEKARRLKETFSTVKQVPIVSDLMHGPLAYIGQRQLVMNQLHFMIMQLSAFHSYHDLQFIVAFREEELMDWEWMRWLPHSQIGALNVRGFLYHQRSRDQILTSFYQVIKERKLLQQQNTRKNEDILFTPHYVFIITEMDLIMDHVIMEYLEEDLTNIGISLLFVEEVIESLPEHVKTIVDIRNEAQGNIIIKEGELVNRRFTPQSFIANSFKEAFSRQLASLEHVQNLGNAIPETITFLEMYQVQQVEELNIEERWQQNEAYRTLAVPLGARGKEDLVQLNLHEKAHGPHGLIAGTTGSGKSELVQSYILSLAVNFHPYEVAFLLIDYKGGGMANLFKDLPHLVGTITNLDGAQSMRALVSIKAELRKRQRLFNENEVNHINQYHRLFKEGQVQEPMPHLFIISDEFAELKAEQPDFMKELVSTARIGRSLGIHLILATQKPSGVVDDQIWSNSKFKIALKVQDTADSNEILKTPDAAQITQTGRAYLQVGNNEIYELFQSAWSGAPYTPDNPGSHEADLTLYAINEKGQYEIISKDLSGMDDAAAPQAGVTELEAVIDEVNGQFTRLEQPRVARPWLPPLAEMLSVEEYQRINFQEAWANPAPDIEVLIGMQDLPERQAQEPWALDLRESGHLMVASSPGYGKSTFIQTLAIDIMRKHAPDQAQFYLFDFGNNGLLPLLEFPHVADHFGMDETEKIEKALRRFQQELKERKRALSIYKVGNVSQYNRIADSKIPQLIIAIDGYDAVRDSPFQEEFERMIGQIARDGVALGMTLIITANRQAAIRTTIQVNLKTKIALYLFDRMDLNGLLGKSGYTAEEIPGRAMVKLDEVTTFQVFLPYAMDNPLEMMQAMKKEAQEMDSFWTGARPQRIPMMPEEVTRATLERRMDVPGLIEAGTFLVGLDYEKVEPATLDWTKPLLLASEKPADLQLYNQLALYNLRHLADFASVMILDASNQMPQMQGQVQYYFSAANDLMAAKVGLVNDIRERKAKPDGEYRKWLIFIHDLERFTNASGITDEEFSFILTEGAKTGIVLLISGNAADLLTGYNRTAKIARRIISQALVGMRISDQEFERFPYVARESYLKAMEAYIIKNQTYQKVRLIDVNEH